ncbi:MAG: quinol:cytochrome C oxidoreductase [Cytophagales bacterium]|nr:MAG: quinol:cytochrome C oxidoreductase [Cytophagales bacterium]
MTEEKFIFSSGSKKKIFTTIGAGLVLMVLGTIILLNKGHHSAHGVAEHAVEHHGSPTWILRIIKDLWLNTVFFSGIALVGVFFVAFNYIAQAGWSVVVKRVAESFGYFLPVGGFIMVLLFLFFQHDLFHWTHHDVYEPGEHFDEILNGKKGYLNTVFFLARMVIYFALWYLIWKNIRNNSLAEDLNSDLKYHDKSIFWSAIFLIVFGVTSSTSSWDWVMSIDPHFFSTMFGWYVLASWFVSGLSMIAIIVVTLKENGYLSVVNSSHLHDLGKFMFAFSIFWSYVWFAQFLLIYYANIPEEAIYFVERLKNDVYSPIFFMNIFINFAFPFLTLMTAQSKRQAIILKIVAIAIIIGHWFDFYIMMTPPLLKQEGGLDVTILFIELGSIMIFGGLFFYFILNGLSKASLVPKNHPMLQESLHHTVHL